MSEWSPKESADLYQVEAWGEGFFSVSAEGQLLVHPRPPTRTPAGENAESAPSIALPRLCLLYTSPSPRD